MARAVCIVMGIAFLIVAAWGFATGDRVLFFHVNTAHNIVHLASGILALACGIAGPLAARWFSGIFGAVYGLVAVGGWLGIQPLIDLLHLNEPDNWLHAGIAVLFLIAALAPATRPREMTLPHDHAGMTPSHPTA